MDAAIPAAAHAVGHMSFTDFFLNADPVVQNNRFFRIASAESATWWRPPYEQANWTNYQDKIAPFWQQALRQEISVRDFHVQAAKYMRGEA